MTTKRSVAQILKKKKKKTKFNFLKEKQMFRSSFVTTDNKFFAVFTYKNEKLVDIGAGNAIIHFEFSENDLALIFDREQELQLNSKGDNYYVNQFGCFNKEILVIFNSISKRLKFYPVTNWNNKDTNRLIVVIPEKQFKPIGIIKTVKEIKDNGKKESS